MASARFSYCGDCSESGPVSKALPDLAGPSHQSAGALETLQRNLGQSYMDTVILEFFAINDY